MRAGIAAIAVAAGLVLAASAQAAGSWIADARTPTLRQRGWVYRSAILTPRPTTPVAGKAITTVNWRYQFIGPSPTALRAALCSDGAGCIALDRPVGRSRGFAGLAPDRRFYFVFRIAGRGMRAAPLRGGPLQLTVDFE